MMVEADRLPGTWRASDKRTRTKIVTPKNRGRKKLTIPLLLFVVQATCLLPCEGKILKITNDVC